MEAKQTRLPPRVDASKTESEPRGREAVKECIREWRSSGKKPAAAGIDRHLDPDMVETTKTCPVCRIKSHFVVPSSVVPVPPKRASRCPNSGGGPPPNPAKEKIVETYLQRKKRIPCRYYQESVRTWKQAIEKKAARSRPNDDDDIPLELSTVKTIVFKPRCRFGNDCHYAHIHPETGKPHTFTEAELERMNPRSRRGRSLYISDRLLDDSLALWEMFRDESARYVIDSANEERRQRDLSPIAISEDLARSASDLDLRILSELEDWENAAEDSDGTDLDTW
ncbi:hypothetical protein KEM56_003516 [Ascosphaera pollenicola]|nr:hypothetical protein KEM56_003516 [Ascosphaera pollenicola]